MSTLWSHGILVATCFAGWCMFSCGTALLIARGIRNAQARSDAP